MYTVLLRMQLKFFFGQKKLPLNQFGVLATSFTVLQAHSILPWYYFI